MSRSNKVQEIVLSEEHKTLRLVLFVLVLAVALTAFTYGIYHLVRKDSGWRTVTVKPAEVGGTCAHEFTFQYKLGSGGAAEYKQVQQVYSDACTYMYEVFSLEPSVLVQGNLYQVNATPGQDVQVDPFLYQTLQQVEESGTRALYLAPVYEYYKSLFQCSDDASAQLVDPAFDADAAEDIRNLCAFINDPEAIRLEFPAENTVRLEVSDAYKAYAEESGVMAYVDLYWLQDAFELDYIAEQLVDNGMTTGYITSRSGLSISLGTVGETCSTQVYDRQPEGIYAACVIEYDAAVRIAAFHDYTTEQDLADRYYMYADGTARFPYIDPKDGACKASIHDLVLVSEQQSLAEMVLEAFPVLVGDTLDLAALNALPCDKVYCNDRTVYASPGLTLTKIFQNEEVTYQSVTLS